MVDFRDLLCAYGKEHVAVEEKETESGIAGDGMLPNVHRTQRLLKTLFHDAVHLSAVLLVFKGSAFVVFLLASAKGHY